MLYYRSNALSFSLSQLMNVSLLSFAHPIHYILMEPIGCRQDHCQSCLSTLISVCRGIDAKATNSDTVLQDVNNASECDVPLVCFILLRLECTAAFNEVYRYDREYGDHIKHTYGRHQLDNRTRRTDFVYLTGFIHR
jgi:hypothetical protein